MAEAALGVLKVSSLGEVVAWVLQSYLGVPAVETLHIGDQFLNTGNDYAARDVSPCIWIIR